MTVVIANELVINCITPMYIYSNFTLGYCVYEYGLQPVSSGGSYMPTL